MAAGAVIFYQHAIEDMMTGKLDLASMTLVVSLISHNYVPRAVTNSVYSADVSTNVVTSSGYADRTLVSSTVAKTSGSYVTWDAADITLSATATIKAKWAVIYRQSTAGGTNQRLVAYFDTETTQTTGVEVTQLVIQWNALGIAQINNPSATP
jgi:hypothetical protein